MNETTIGKAASPLRTARWQRTWPALFCLATAAAFLTICTKSSPLYPMNDWVDVNTYFTIGRKMAKGTVLYRDIFDHKGPLLYFIYTLIAWFSPRSFWGVFIVEIVCVCAFLYFSGRCAGLYLKNRGLICALLLLLGAAVLPSWAFTHGGSVEEMCLFMATGSLYLVLRAVRAKEPVPGRDTFLIGLFASAVFWIKYTMCGVFFGLCLVMIPYYLLGLRQPKLLLRAMGWFLLGAAAVTGPVLLYFVVNGALRDLFEVYFYDNIFTYTSTDKMSLLDMVGTAWHNSCLVFRDNPAFMGLTVLGGLCSLRCVRRRPWETLTVLLPLAALGYVALGSKYDRYYGLYYASFSILGLIALGQLAQWAAGKLPPRTLPAAAGVCLCAALGAGMLFYAYRTSPNVYLLQYEKDDMPQYKFAKIIDREPGATLLNYCFQDSGFYFASGVDPELKYFFLPNVQPPELIAEQTRYMRQQLADFLVVRDAARRDLVEAVPGYTLLAQADMEFEGTVFTYYLLHS